MRSELLKGRTQQRFFSSEESEALEQPFAHPVNLESEAELDATNLSAREINEKIRELMLQGMGSIRLKNLARSTAWLWAFLTGSILR